MSFVIKKYITPRKQSIWRKPINVLLIIVAVPVTVIAGISLIIYYSLYRIAGLFLKPASNTAMPERYHLELELLHNQHVHISMVEDEADAELVHLNEQWADEVHSQETSLFRAKTNPRLPSLEGRICCYYLKELPQGAVLQVLDDNSSGEYPATLHTQLVYLNYEDLSLNIIDETGPYYLYNEEKNQAVIKGFNAKNYIEIELALTDA